MKTSAKPAAKPAAVRAKRGGKSDVSTEVELTQPEDYTPPSSETTPQSSSTIDDTKTPGTTRINRNDPYDGTKYHVFFSGDIPAITVEPNNLEMFEELKDDYKDKLQEGEAEMHQFTAKEEAAAFIVELVRSKTVVPVVTPVKKTRETDTGLTMGTAAHVEKAMAGESTAASEQALIKKMISASQKFAHAPKITVYYTSNSYGLGNTAIYIIRVVNEKGEELWSFKPEPMMQCFKSYTEVIPFEEDYLNTLITNMQEGFLRKPGGAPDEIKHSTPRSYKKKDNGDENSRKYRKTEQKIGSTWPQKAIWTYGPRLTPKKAELMAMKLAQQMKEMIPSKVFQATCENIMCKDPGTFSTFFAAIDNENAKYYSTLWHTMENIRLGAEKVTMDRWKSQFVTEVVDLMNHVHKTGKLYG